MKIAMADVIHIIIALFLVIGFAHVFGYFFRKYKQPVVVGEILAGLLLGPSCFAYFFPDAYAFVFQENALARSILSLFYHLGLLHLMFCAGIEIHTRFKKRGREALAILLIIILGTVIPFLGSYFFVDYFDISKLIGAANNETAFILIFALSTAVCSIGIISRIFLDLKIFHTAIARIVVSAAVIEDFLLFVVLTIALGMVGVSFGGEIGLPVLLGLKSTHSLLLYHVFMPCIFFSFFLYVGPKVFRFLFSIRKKFFQEINFLAFLILFMFLMSGIAMLLDIAPMFGAFTAGIIAQNFGEEKTQEIFESYSYAFFIPIYFAFSGLRLDLIHGFNILTFLAFLALAFAMKFASVYTAGRLAGIKPKVSASFAIALNTRGGQGIVLATLALDNFIINDQFYAVLIMFALLTTFVCGTWLNHRLSKRTRHLA
jgi:Kef-type K+ transport system membrane component KefB